MMTTFQYGLPTTLYFGENCLSVHGEMLCRHGHKALVVTGRQSARLCGALEDVTSVLTAGGVTWQLFDQVEENPSLKTCVAGNELARAFGADFVVAIGGGSPLDAGKAMAVLATNDYERPEQLFDTLLSPPLPLVAIPTTAGTGSEINAIAVLTTDDRLYKRSIRHLFPSAAFCDPRYLRQLPQKNMISCALDAFCHGVESYFVPSANPFSEMFALQAAKLVWPTLLALAQGTTLSASALADLSIGAAMGGAAIQATGTGIPHPLGYNLTLDASIPHGAATAVFLPYFLGQCLDEHPGKADELSRALGVLPGEISALVNSLHGVSLHLTPAQAKVYAGRVASSSQFAQGPIVMTPQDIESVYLELFSGVVV